VVQEAMASGLVVIGANVSQTSEVLAGAGVLATPGSSESFAGAIGRLLENRAQVDALRRRSLELSASRDWDTVFDGLEERYLATIAAHRRR
jgi:glycosyltransferase involved in cell wall biosynthesis